MPRSSISGILIPTPRRTTLGWLGFTGFVCVVGCLGCQGQKDENAPAASASASTVTVQSAAAALSAAPKAHPKFGRHTGIASGLFRAANDLSLPQAEQQSLDKIEENLRSDDGAVHTALKAFRADLVAGVRGDKLDATKLAADDAAIDAAVSAHQAKEAEALDALHTLLTPEQRAALVAAIKEKRAERESHAAGWLNGKEADGGTTDWTKRRLDRLTAELSLDSGQQRQAAAILSKPSGPPSGAALQTRWEDRKKRYDAILTAFAADTLDSKTLDLAIMPGKTAHEPMDRMVEFFTTFLPILHPDQRDKLAISIDRPFGTMGRPGADGGPSARSATDDIAFPFVEPSETPPGEDPAGAR
jgi:Spy/CpxP family protein refolding chaperone